MLPFEIKVNNNCIGKCGFEDWSLLDASLLALKQPNKSENDNIYLRVGGLSVVNTEDVSHYVRFLNKI